MKAEAISYEFSIYKVTSTSYLLWHQIIHICLQTAICAIFFFDKVAPRVSHVV